MIGSILSKQNHFLDHNKITNVRNSSEIIKLVS